MASHRALRPLGLEAFSLRCARRLLARHPEWLPFAVSEVDAREGLRTLAIHLPSQNPRVPEPLTISVGLDRIVAVSWFARDGAARWNVDWVTYHRSSALPNQETDDEGLDRVADFVEAFTAERIAAFWTDDGPDAPSRLVTTGVVTAREVRDGAFRRGRARTEIRSWRGSLDLSLWS